jgi:CheY-like chemotaxis protein
LPACNWPRFPCWDIKTLRLHPILHRQPPFRAGLSDSRSAGTAAGNCPRTSPEAAPGALLTGPVVSPLVIFDDERILVVADDRMAECCYSVTTDSEASQFSGSGSWMARSLRILIVDDRLRARQSLKAVVTTWLHIDDVQEAETGAQAVARVEEWLPDVILMDARMPGMDGIEATRLIKARWPNTRVIVLSIYSEYRQDALAAGADAFIGKAEPPEHLLQTLSSLADTTLTNSSSLT